MRTPVLLLAAPALLLAGLTGAPAQSPGAANMPNTTLPGSTPTPTRPSAENPNPMTPAPQATDRRSYANMLQSAADAIRQEIPRVEGGVAPTQTGATPPALQQLMHAMSEARHVVERAPANFTDNEVYQATVREMRDRYGDITTRNPRQPEALEAARGMIGSLDRLRQAASAG